MIGMWYKLIDFFIPGRKQDPEIIYIVAPFAEAPAAWMSRVSKYSKHLMRKNSNRIILNVHCSIYNGAYGDDANPEDRASGIRVTTHLLHFLARQENSYLHVLGFSESSKVKEEIEDWRRIAGESRIVMVIE